MKTLRIGFLPLFLAALMVSILYAGSGNRRGTGGASELLIPVGARDLAMGGSTISTTHGVDALFWNPAGVAKLTSSASLMLSPLTRSVSGWRLGGYECPEPARRPDPRGVMK